jgi:hypothetical protein
MSGKEDASTAVSDCIASRGLAAQWLQPVRNGKPEVSIVDDAFGVFMKGARHEMHC